MEIFVIAGLLLSLSPYGLVMMIIARQINKKRRLERKGWEQKDDYLHPISHMWKFPKFLAISIRHN